MTIQVSGRYWMAAVLSAGLVGCGQSETVVETPAVVEPAAQPAAPTPGATARLQTAAGAAAGTATATAGADGIVLVLRVEGLPPGEHGVHVHMTGKCEAPTFESAGDHWNPGAAKHGLENPQGQHAGDMPNLTVGADGRGTLDYTLKGGDLAGLLDADGAAFVVHAKADDQKTDPSGDSGDRVACGVFGAG